MSEICNDNRFEIISAYKKKLIEWTNIETSPDEMAVIDNVLFRFWQMGWLPPLPHGRLIDADELGHTHNEFAYGKGNFSFHMTAKAWVDGAPTIIPADPAEEER